jgi:hypothetical protein
MIDYEAHMIQKLTHLGLRIEQDGFENRREALRASIIVNNLTEVICFAPGKPLTFRQMFEAFYRQKL